METTDVYEINKALDSLYCERKLLENELKRIESSIQNNISFEDYITSLGLIVKDPLNGNEIIVNKDTLVGYADISDLLEAKKKKTYSKLMTIDKEIARLNQQQDEECIN